MHYQHLLNITLTTALVALTVKTQYLDKQQLTLTRLDVQSITVQEPDGSRRLQIANSHYSPPVIINGKTLFHPGPRPGLIFYNDEGSENGGLMFMGKKDGDQVRHGVHLSMDRYNQDQAVALQHIEQENQLISGLNIIDRPRLAIDTYLPLAQKAQAGDLDAQQQLAQLAQASGENIHGARRAFYGTINDKALLQLNDAAGNKRLELTVAASGDPQLVFYHADGSVWQRLPAPPSSQPATDGK